MASEELSDLLKNIDADHSAHSRRIAACGEVTDGLTKAGRILWVSGWTLRDKPMEGLAILTEISAELAVGAVEMFKNELWYAGSALVRQLIETEYLMSLFAQDKEEASRWINSSPAEICSQFTPAAMRKKNLGKFRDSEYWTHSDRGGHPAPTARFLLKDHSNSLGTLQWLWLDLLFHLSRLWSAFRQALVLQGTNDILPVQVIAQVDDAILQWRQSENPMLLSIELP